MKRREQRLRVDWPACRARGLCFELLPEVVRLDDWGYPVVDDAVPRHLVGQAREAVRACPTLALHLIKSPASTMTAHQPLKSATFKA